MLGNPQKKEIIILIKQIRCQLALGGLTSPFGQSPLPKKLIITCTNNRIQNCHQRNNK